MSQTRPSPTLGPDSYSGTYRAAIIGHTGRGDYGHGLALAFWGLPRIEVVAVADPLEAGRAPVAARAGAARQFASYQEMLERERPDVVAVATRWPDQHEAMITTAVAAGVRAIYCEKPLASALDEADRIVAACDAAGVKLNVAHHNRVRPLLPYVKGLLAAGQVGRLRAVRAIGKCDRRGGGEDLLVLGTHLLDMMRYFAGDALWCDARVTVNGRDAVLGDVHHSAREMLGPLLGDDVAATYGFAAGVTGSFESTRAGDFGGNGYFRLTLCGTDGQLSVQCDPGTPVSFYPRAAVALDGGDGWQQLAPAPALTPVGAPEQPGQFFDSNQAMVCDLLAAVEEGRETLSSARDGRAALEMILAVYQAHLTGGRVTMPLVQREHPLAGA